MNNSDYYHPHSQLESDQQHNMQPQQQRYGGGGNRGGSYQRQTQGPGGGGNLQRHQHPNQQPSQQQQGQGVGPQGPGATIRHTQSHQQPQLLFQPQAVQYVSLPNPAGQQQQYRYQIPTPYPTSQYPINQFQMAQQQQMYTQMSAAAASYAAAYGNVYFAGASQPPQVIHHNTQQYYPQQVQPPAMTPHFVRPGAPTALSMAQVQAPPQQPQVPHAVAVQGHQPQLVQPQTLNVLPQTVVAAGLVTHAPLPPHESNRDHHPPPRQRRVLKITNPNTGEVVIKGDEGFEHPSPSPQPTAESVGLPEEPQVVTPSCTTVHPEQVAEVAYDGMGVMRPAQSISEEPQSQSLSVPISADDTGKNKAKADFFQLITAAADEPTGRSNSSPDALVVTGPGAQTHASNTPLLSSQPTSAVPVGTVAFEPPVAASAPPAFTHSQIPPTHLQKHTATSADTEQVVSVTSLPQLPKEESQSEPTEISVPSHPETKTTQPSATSEPEIMTASTGVPDMPLPVPVSNQENSNNADLPSTPPSSARGGRGDQFLDLSMTSISPDPIEKYIEITPDKAPTDVSQKTESGEPTSLANSVNDKENDDGSSNVPSLPLPVKLEGSLSPTSLNQVNAEDETSKVVRNFEELSITAVEPAQIEPAFTNGGNEIDDECSGEDDLEEGELHEGEGESDETGGHKRIVYDRATLINCKAGASSKNLQGMDLIPPELVREGNSPLNIGQLPRGQVGNFGGVGGGNYGNRNIPQGGRMGNNNNTGPFSNRMRGMGGQGGWDPARGPFQIPPQPPGPNRPPVSIQLKPVTLHKAENAWKPGRNVDETKDKEQLLIEEMKKKTRGILNKLTPENFDKLVEKFLMLKFEEELKDPEKRTDTEKAEAEHVTAERIGAVISVVFEKAIDEPSFSTAYAKMVHRVHSEASAVTSKIFRKKILDQCQKEFQQGNSAEEDVKLLEEKLAEAEEDKKALIKLEIEDKKFTARRRSLGNVRFIGELYKLQMLTPKIMIECVNMLITNRDEESLECLCKLLTTVGQKLEQNILQIIETIKKKPTAGKWNPDAKFMLNTFNVLKALSEDKALSSRIRFALLDVVELRESGWKPRRDANAPKTIEEVRKAAAREEQEEKKQLMNLPQPPPPSRGGILPPVPKKAEWNTVPSSKSSRFSAAKKSTSDNSGEMPKFAPGGGSWVPTRGGSGFPPGRNSMAPRFSQVREFSDGPPPTPSRDDIVQELPQARTPSSTSSRESSRPHTPTRENNTGSPRILPPSRKTPPPQQQPPPPPPEQISDFNVPDSVKQIFNEFLTVKKVDYDWIDKRFPGKRVTEFVAELSRQVCDMSKEENQKTAGGLVKNLIKSDRITKAQVIESLKSDVMVELPDIQVDVPQVTTYFAMFLSELFADEDDLGWLIPLGEVMEEASSDDWASLVASVLSTLKLRHSEEVVQGLYEKTSGANRLPIQPSHSWVYGEPIESIVTRLEKVLHVVSDQETLSSVLQENSCDFRKEIIVKGVTEAICVVCWSESDRNWDTTKLHRFFSQLPRLPSTKHFRIIWNQVRDFMNRMNVAKDQQEVIWAILSKLEITPIENAK